MIKISKGLMRRLSCFQRSFSSSSNPLTKLSEDDLMLKESVRRFALDMVKPHVQEMDETSVMRPEIVQACFEQGLMGIETPEDLGGAGMSFFSCCLVIEELARTDPSVSAMVDVHALANQVLLRWANDEQKARWLPRLASDTLASFCLSEWGSGSDAFAMKTRAEDKGDHFVINGSKAWITNSVRAGLFIVFANMDPSLGYKGISAFVVDNRNTEGLKVMKPENKLGIRASGTCEVLFEDVKVPKENLLGPKGKGYKIAIESLNEGRIGIASQMTGLAQGALDLTIPYITERKQFGQRIADFQGMQFAVARSLIEIESARLMVYNAARLKEAGEPFLKEAAMAKVYSSEVAESVASRCVDAFGGMGFVKDSGIEKFYRDAKIGKIYEGTTNICLQTIAKNAIPKDKQ